MSSIEEKLKELAQLAEQLDEAAKSDDIADTQVDDDKKRDVADADKDGDRAEVKADTSDEPEGSKEDQIEDDAEGEDDKKIKKDLEEAVSRKDFKSVASTVAAIESPEKRQEFADHHAKIFAAANPRFDHAKFHAACGTKAKTNESVEETQVETQKIDLGALFEGQELSEDFKLKTIAVFEAAVEARVAEDVAELKESMEQEAATAATALEESLVEKVDGYLDYMVEQWMEKNALAVNRGIKTEILESFVGGLKSLFEDHYIDVPDEKYDLVEATQTEISELEAKLDEAVEENIALRSSLKETARLIQIEEAVDGLAETDAEKFRELAESLTYTSEEEYGKKLQGLRENYFTKSSTPEVKPLQEEFMTDTPVEVVNEEVKLDPVMARYVANLSK
jgi:hypothetical protein